RSSRYQKQISRSAAVTLLGQILNQRNNIVPVEGLSSIPVNHMLESALEERFVQALSRVGKLTRYRYQNKSAYRLQVDAPSSDAAARDASDGASESVAPLDGVPDRTPRVWLIEPQVEFNDLSDGIQTRADFVIRPLKEADRRPELEMVVYVDGFQHHWDKVNSDLQKRLALMKSGRAVWVLSWHDLNDDDTGFSNDIAQHIMGGNGPEEQEVDRIWQQLASRNGWSSIKQNRDLWYQSAFQQLASWLRYPEQAGQHWQQAALYWTLRHGLPARNSTLNQDLVRG